MVTDTKSDTHQTMNTKKLKLYGYNNREATNVTNFDDLGLTFAPKNHTLKLVKINWNLVQFSVTIRSIVHNLTKFTLCELL